MFFIYTLTRIPVANCQTLATYGLRRNLDIIPSLTSEIAFKKQCLTVSSWLREKDHVFGTWILYHANSILHDFDTKQRLTKFNRTSIFQFFLVLLNATSNWTNTRYIDFDQKNSLFCEFHQITSSPGVRITSWKCFNKLSHAINWNAWPIDKVIHMSHSTFMHDRNIIRERR